MANTLTPLIQTILARGLMVLRKTCIMPQLVNSEYSLTPQKKGSTIQVPYSRRISAYDISPSNTLKAPTARTMDYATITLNKWKGSNFGLNDQEMTQINARQDFLPLQTVEAIQAIATDVNTDLLALYKNVYGYTGTAGTTPFSNATDRTATKDATNLRKVLNTQLCPKEGRNLILSPIAEAEALALPQFSNLAASGDPNVVRLGSLGMKYGFNFFSDEDIPTHTKGAAGTVLTDQADIEVGDTTVHFDGLTTKASVGDVFTVAGDSQTYVVTAASDLTGTDGDMSFQPPAKVAWGDSVEVTFKASHEVNLGFTRDAFAFASAPLEDNGDMLPGTIIQSLQDPVSGLVLRLEVSRQNKQTLWEFDMLYGVACVRPECAARLAG